MKRRSLIGAVVVMAAVMAGGWLAMPAHAQQKIVIKGQHTLAESHPYHLGMAFFAKRIAEKTNGRIQVDLFPNGQLGFERDAIEGFAVGTTQLTVTSTAALASFVQEIQVLDLWFLFRDPGHMYRVLDGPLGDRFKDRVAQSGKGMRVLSWWDGGIRDIYTNKKPVRSLEDLKGMKIRTFENPIYVESLRALGALATPMAFGEVYSALQQGVIDGAEGASLTYHSVKHHEPAPYLSLTHHTYGASVFMISERLWGSLPADLQRAAQEVAYEARDFQRKEFNRLQAEVLDILKGKGVTIVTPPQEPFRQAILSTYPKFEKVVSKEAIEQIRSTR
ncbi:MAG: TRAP transporter substrate-binding protein [candidate division NC10 bacterium]|nr:TRAP transporter substrate-binding protein [candidate division NC10 bacterium]MBI2115959.1 TRAP transporter substrate-binding protein [candidate division NC10 bacterium]MBI2456018.1 TRAP transporter substrate-binding protein [candidate division NC10 bacterium]MBI2561638.1 TRAP transporter substrate-binding protein [candidate division NC10 bacterium]MBI3122265.1 TRAP transporter substrate-binding protein [candidate division NC10 bacterium]